MGGFLAKPPPPQFPLFEVFFAVVTGTVTELISVNFEVLQRFVAAISARKKITFYFP